MTACGCATEHGVIETLGEANNGPVGFYVSVRDHGRSGLLLGPYETHAEALAKVALGKQLAESVNSRACWYSYGTAKVTGGELKEGLLNGLAENKEEA